MQKKLFSTIFIILGIALNPSIIFSKNGDSLQVVTHNKVLIQTDPSRGVTNYYGWGQFPKAGNYQKMYAELTFQCPTGMTCGEWDYNNHIRIANRKGTFNDSLGWEIMRLITPYGLGFSNTWSHTWKFDLTDFQHLFRDSVQIWYQHSGYEARNGRGWVITLKFTMIEGPSIRPVLDMQRMYSVWASYGNDSLFDVYVPEYKWTSPKNTISSRIKVIQTGHGMDQPSNCAEFCPKRRYINLDSQIVDSSYVWRDDCGSNPVFPQNGTWLYDRAGWCPGQSVKEFNYDFNDSSDRTHRFDLDMESYVRTGGGSNYVISSYLVNYGAHTYQHDAAITEIIRPTTDPEYGRLNPICDRPEIIVRNQGAQQINSIDFEYGIAGGTKTKYHYTAWEPFLFNEVRLIALPTAMNWDKVSGEFEVSIVKVNGATDEEIFNNTLKSKLPAQTPTLPNRIVVAFKTNNAPMENSYRFKDMEGHILFERKNFTKVLTIYRDTFELPSGCYTFEFSDTGTPNPAYPLNEDGLVWWANTTDGTGTLQLRNGNSGALIKSFAGDFGTDIQYNFTVGYTLNSPNLRKKTGNMRVMPNPAHEGFGVDLEELFANNANSAALELCDLSGKTLMNIELKPGFSQFQWINTANFTPGVYFVKFKQNNELCTRKIVLY